MHDGVHLSRQDLIQTSAQRYRTFRTAKERELGAALSRLRSTARPVGILVNWRIGEWNRLHAQRQTSRIGL